MSEEIEKDQTGSVGRPKTYLTDKQKEEAYLYVKNTGLYWVRLSNFLGMDFKTLKRIVDEDKDFSNGLERARAFYIGELIELTKKRRPDFLLETQSSDEFKRSATLELRSPEDEIKQMKQYIDEQIQTMDKDVS